MLAGFPMFVFAINSRASVESALSLIGLDVQIQGAVTIVSDTKKGTVDLAWEDEGRCAILMFFGAPIVGKKHRQLATLISDILRELGGVETDVDDYKIECKHLSTPVR